MGKHFHQNSISFALLLKEFLFCFLRRIRVHKSTHLHSVSRQFHYIAFIMASRGTQVALLVPAQLCCSPGIAQCRQGTQQGSESFDTMLHSAPLPGLAPGWWAPQCFELCFGQAAWLHTHTYTLCKLLPVLCNVKHTLIWAVLPEFLQVNPDKIIVCRFI